MSKKLLGFRFGFRTMNFRFFDDTGAGPEPVQEPAPDYGGMDDDGFQKELDRIRYMDFGDEPDATPAPDTEQGAPSEPDTGDAPATTEPPAQALEPAPAPKQDTTPAAAAASDQQTGIPPQILEKYAPLIGALESNEGFRQAVADAIAAQRTGGLFPVEAPQAQQQQEDKEPVQGEDELTEDFEKRHAAWEQRQADRRVQEQVERVIQERVMVQQRDEMIRHAYDVNELLMQDTERASVGEFFKGNPAPPRLVQLMQSDPDVFMYIYDGMRQIIGKGNYFAEVFAARRGGWAGVQPATQARTEPQPQQGAPTATPAPQAQQTSGTPIARTVVKW